jgi:hypothetical protein
MEYYEETGVWLLIILLKFVNSFTYYMEMNFIHVYNTNRCTVRIYIYMHTHTSFALYSWYCNVCPDDGQYGWPKHIGIRQKQELLYIYIHTRWFKYDRDKLWLVYTQIVPVIFEPPCVCVYIYIYTRDIYILTLPLLVLHILMKLLIILVKSKEFLCASICGHMVTLAINTDELWRTYLSV